ncbi:MAG: hypothetical protein JST44_21820 [Cyanobacteria bacterium SZAS LIN-5]|nr:hypothetical protein [Cyanobacteria bacterium SZAS LIN-5]
MSCKRARRHRILRSCTGSSLALVVTIFIGILVVLAFFALSFVRTVGGHQEQETAIEAASLAAAKSLSKVVIDDPAVGLVGLSNSPPAYKNTMAQDNYYTPVRSINSLLATNRLDMVIADLLDDDLLRQCADFDYARLMQARQRLSAELVRCVERGAHATDADGGTLTPWDDALAAYESNGQRMTGSQTKLLVDTLKITLGGAEAIATNCPIPRPSKYARLNTDEQSNYNYVAYKNIVFRGKSFVFAGTSSSSCLVDVKNFRETMPNLPYLIPCVVKCEGTQEFVEKNSRRLVHCAACAQPPCLQDTCPHPGALSVSFPGKGAPEITSLYSIFANKNITKSPTDLVQTPTAADYPNAPLTVVPLPVLGEEHPRSEKVIRLAFYDWVRRGGETLDVQSLLEAMNKPIDTTSGGKSFLYECQKDGVVTVTAKAINPLPELPVSQNQWRSVSGIALHSTNGSFFDVIVKDYVNQPGRNLGGLHAGEPLGEVEPSSGGPIANNSISDPRTSVGTFPMGPGGGAPRPTYFSGGTAVDIRFRERIVNKAG